MVNLFQSPPKFSVATFKEELQESLPANAEVMELAKEGILKEPVRKVLRAGGKKRLSAH